MKIVVSGVNLVEGGTLKIYRDALTALNNFSKEKLTIYALVHKKELFDDLKLDSVTFLEYPLIKKSWIKRIYFEYYLCNKLSKDISPDIWLSIHDITPNVITDNLYVYCHNASPVYKARLKDLKFDKKFFAFCYLYKYLYKINIKKAKSVIAQQKWFGEYLKNELGASSYLVSKPVQEMGSVDQNKGIVSFKNKEVLSFFYPALPRTFKNFELLFDAFEIFCKKFPEKSDKIKLYLTFNENDNAYANYLIKKNPCPENIIFLGRLSFDIVQEYYANCDVLIFPSLLESWGLPISEAKALGKPIILSELPYAHETLGSYSSAKFIDPHNPYALSEIINDMMSGKDIFCSVDDPSSSYGLNWDETVEYMIKNAS